MEGGWVGMLEEKQCLSSPGFYYSGIDDDGSNEMSESSVTGKKSPNVNKSYPKMISLDKWKIIFTKMHKILGAMGRINVATGF